MGEGYSRSNPSTNPIAPGMPRSGNDSGGKKSVGRERRKSEKLRMMESWETKKPSTRKRK
jgi:hypothetical protein